MRQLRENLFRIAKEASETALSVYERHDYAVDTKSDLTLVTEADRTVETLLKKRLGDLLPQALFIGEETGSAEPDLDRLRESEWVWAVDPIDGTTVFVDQIGTFTVCIGLLHQGQPFAGAVALPAMGQIACAVKGEGAWYSARPIRVLENRPSPTRTTLYTNSTAHREYRMTFPGKVRSLGSTAHHYLLVARGVALGAVASAHIWDYAGVAAILVEAGGIIKHLDGSEVDWPRLYDGSNANPPLLGAPPRFWDEVADTLEQL